MKTPWIVLAAALVAVATARAADEGAGAGGPGGGPLREHLRQVFDANGDGQLTGDELEKAKAAAEKMKLRADANGDGQVSEEEKQAAMDKMRGFRDEIVKKYDKDGDGKLNEEEREAAKKAVRDRIENGDLPGKPAGDAPRGERPGPPSREEMLKKFDKDGDGKLSEEEREAAREAMRRHREGGGDRPRRGDGEGRRPRAEGGGGQI